MSNIILPIAVFLVTLIVLSWLTRLALRQLDKLWKKLGWQTYKLVLRTLNVPSLLWSLVIAIFLALASSNPTLFWEELVSKCNWTIFLVSIAIAIYNLANELVTFYEQKRLLPENLPMTLKNIALLVVVIISVLMILHIWDVPISPLSAVINWLETEWTIVVIPIAVFAVTLIAMFWLRKLASERLVNWFNKTKWQADKILLRALKGPSAIWCLIIAVYLAFAVSAVPDEWKNPISKGIWTILLASITLAVLNITGGLILFYGNKLNIPRTAVVLFRNVVRIAILIVVVLIALDIWGVPTSPLLLLIAVVVLAAVLAFRDAVPNFFAALQMSASQEIKIGDYIKLPTGEEGYVTEINWNHTHIKGVDESIVIIPNNRLLQHTVINYGHPLKKAREPFRFNSRTHLRELTGLRAKNLRELADTLKKVPDSVVYYHTHRFLEEHHYLTPELSNDFAVWVTDTLGDVVLGERLASVDTFEFTDLGALRTRLVSIIEEHLTREHNLREAAEDSAFHFVKSVSVILPTPYVAHDLREFIETLRKISLESLNFHMFESRLRLGKGISDFSIWLERELDDRELSKEIARIDPYTYTLEGLRLALIQIIEKRIK